MKFLLLTILACTTAHANLSTKPREKFREVYCRKSEKNYKGYYPAFKDNDQHIAIAYNAYWSEDVKEELLAGTSLLDCKHAITAASTTGYVCYSSPGAGTKLRYVNAKNFQAEMPSFVKDLDECVKVAQGGQPDYFCSRVPDSMNLALKDTSYYIQSRALKFQDKFPTAFPTLDDCNAALREHGAPVAPGNKNSGATGLETPDSVKSGTPKPAI